MKKLALCLAFVIAFAGYATSATVYLEATETMLPKAPEGGVGTFELTISVEDVSQGPVPSYSDDPMGLQAMELYPTFSDAFGPSDQFALKFDPAKSGEEPWKGRAVEHNTDLIPSIQALYGGGQTHVGVANMTEVWSDDPLNPQLLGYKPIAVDEKTWVLKATYIYSSQAQGTYDIGLDDENSLLAWGEDASTVIPYDLVGDTITIGEQVIPEPTTMALLGMGLFGLVGYSRKRNRK